MKYFWMLAVLVLLGGCQPSQEDHDFFYSGWVNPEEGANMRMYGTKKAPEELHGHNDAGPLDHLSEPTPAGN